MYICIYIYIHTHMYIYTHTHTYTNTLYINLHIYIYTYVPHHYVLPGGKIREKPSSTVISKNRVSSWLWSLSTRGLWQLLSSCTSEGWLLVNIIKNMSALCSFCKVNTSAAGKQVPKSLGVNSEMRSLVESQLFRHFLYIQPILKSQLFNNLLHVKYILKSQL